MERRRVLIEDGRGADRHLRVTWHPETGQFNVSTWHRDVCSGAVRLDAEEAARLINLLSAGMAEAITQAKATNAPPTDEPDHHPLGRRLRVWAARHLGQLRRAS